MDNWGRLETEEGLLKVAYVVSQDSIPMLIVYKIADQIKEFKTQFKNFTDTDKALSWLNI